MNTFLLPCPEDPSRPYLTEYDPRLLWLADQLKDPDNHSVWNWFFHQFAGPIQTLALRSGCSPVEAQDVLQETVCCVARTISRFRSDPASGSFRSWLMHIAYRRSIDALRLRRREASWQEELLPGSGDCDAIAPEDLQSRDPSPADRAELKELWEIILNAIRDVQARVNSRSFAAYRLACLESRSLQEISAELGLTRQQIYLAKHRVSSLVRARFWDLLGRDHSAGRR